MIFIKGICALLTLLAAGLLPANSGTVEAPAFMVRIENQAEDGITSWYEECSFSGETALKPYAQGGMLADGSVLPKGDAITFELLETEAAAMPDPVDLRLSVWVTDEDERSHRCLPDIRLRLGRGECGAYVLTGSAADGYRLEAAQ